ncbi:MAG: TonB-dependent receptor [Pseudomonadales bacterium]
MDRKKLIFAMAASQLAVFAPIPVYSEPMLEEVVVTARKRPESLMDAPVAVSVVSGDSMDRSGVTNLEQLSSKVPGLQLGRAAQTSSIYIRGIGSGVNKGFEQSAGMYVDGIYQMRSRQFTQSMVDLARVEVLRGPQSLLFGKNTIAGAIKVESASPAPGDGLNGSITLDSEPEYGTVRGTAVVSGDLTDNLAGRIAVRYQESDGYVESRLIDQDVAEKEDTMYRVSLAWEPTDTVAVTGKFAHTESDGEGIEQVNNVADPSLLQGFGTNQLGVTAVMGSIAAFQVPGFGPDTGTQDYESWTGNTDFVPVDIEESESNQASLRVEWDAGDYTLTSLSGYTDFDLNQDHDVDFQPGNAVHSVEFEELETFSQEFRFASNYDGFFNFTAGIYYEEQELTVENVPYLDGTLGGVFGTLPASSLNPALPDVPLSGIGINSLWNGQVFTSLNPAASALIGAEQDIVWRNSHNDTETDTLAVFLELTFDLSDTLFLDVGGRYSEDTKKTHKLGSIGVGSPGQNVTVFGPDGVPTGALDAQNSALVSTAWSLLNTFPQDNELERNEYHFDPSVRLRWDVGDETMLYLSYSTGYKSGGFNSSGDTANPDGTPGDGTEFEDEEAEAWELGVKTTLWDGRARVSTTLFRTELEDQQVTSFRGTTFLVNNAASLVSQGVEFESQIALTKSWEVGGSLAYLDSEYEDYQGAPCTVFQAAAIGDSCTQDFSGERGPNAPEWSGTVYASYDHSLGENLMFRFNIDASYKDDYFLDGDLDPNVLQESYVKVNARIGISSAADTWEVALYGRNLTDEATYSFAVDAPLSAGIYGAWAEEPRIIGLQGRYNF